MQWIEWRWRQLDEFDARDLYAMLELRQRIFVVEQQCVYLDADGLDGETEHLTGHDGETLVSCLRVLPAGVHGPEAAIGRVAVDRRYRGQGIARRMMERAIARIRSRQGPVAIRLAGQEHLVPFYASFGFDPVSEPYDEDGIPHVDMVLDDGAGRT